jgi:hypothetical protein
VGSKKLLVNLNIFLQVDVDLDELMAFLVMLGANGLGVFGETLLVNSSEIGQ